MPTIQTHKTMIKPPPLTELHRANGAQFVEEEGWLLPSRFGDPLREYHSVRSKAGLIDLCYYGVLQFTGADRVPYLNGMVSNEIRLLAPGRGTYAAVLDIQGKIQSDTAILESGDSFLMILPGSVRENIVQHLNRYLIADEVEIADLTDRYTMVSLQGPAAGLLIRELARQEDLPQDELGHFTLPADEFPVRVIRATHTGEEGFDFIVPIDDLVRFVSRLQEIGGDLSLGWIGTQAQDVLRIEAGIPRYGIDMSADNLLLETGLAQHVSFSKGCYLGQEVVERIRSRGHVNRKLTGLRLHVGEPAARGDAIHSDSKEIGQITSSALSPHLGGPIALGYVHRDFVTPGTRVTVRHKEISLAAEIHELPFYKAPQYHS